MLNMVAGFLFCHDRVLLVQKQQPVWQLGLWNAVGGKVDGTETAEDAMVREFHEETRVLVGASSWSHFATEEGQDYAVHFFSASISYKPPMPDFNDTQEPLRWHWLQGISAVPVVGNLHWLIPLARDWRRQQRPVLFRFEDDIKERASW